ncbi:MAG: protein kinase [Ruminococcus sp.]|nr:protein kinase [Ruminococcus sp.]
MGDLKHCYKCMEEYDAELHVCPHCGYDENTPHNPMYIAPGTLLHEKYLCGILLEFNGEGATYAGKDISTGKKVQIREYMPITLCTRIKNRSTISVNYNNLAKYKAFMAEYTELNKSLARLRNNQNIIPVLDMFAENNTTYTIFEHIEGVKLLDYLKENAGELSWDQVSRVFPPLFTTIGILHNSGIIHRAISPDTVYINDKGELKLCGFSVAAVRTVNAGLEYELFKGYAAPEQYSASSNSRQGTWTDVYGVSALLYRALTGCMPIDSVTRLKHDDLHEPYILDSRIPPHVSSVIMKGMSLSGRDRIQTITELVTQLFEQPSDDEETATVAAIQAAEAKREAASRQQAANNMPRLQRRNPNQPVHRSAPPQPQHRQEPVREHRYRDEEEYSYERPSTVDKIKVPIIISILLIAILMIIGVFVYNIINEPQEEEDPRAKRKSSTSASEVVDEDSEITSDSSGDIEMPSLIGRFYEQTSEKWAEYFTLEPEYEYTEDYAMDMIYEQSIEEGTMITQGAVIEVKVSKGKISAIIPDFKDLTVAQYKIRLEKAGIPEDNYEMVEAKTGNGATDSITEIQLDGEKVDPGTMFNNKAGKKLTIYYVSAKTVNGTTAVYNESYNDTTVAYNYTDTTTVASYYEEPTQQAVWTEPPTQAAYTDPPAPVATDPPAPVVPDPPAPVTPPADNGGGGGGEAPAE